MLRPVVQLQEVVVQVPVPQVQTVEKMVEVPQVQVVEKAVATLLWRVLVATFRVLSILGRHCLK